MPILLAPFSKSVYAVISLNFGAFPNQWTIGWNLVIITGPAVAAKQLLADVNVHWIARMKYRQNFVLFGCVTANGYKCTTPSHAFSIKVRIFIAYAAVNQGSGQSASCRSRHSSERSGSEPTSCNDWPDAWYGQRSQSGEESCSPTCYGTYRRAATCASRFFVGIGRDHADF